MKRLKFILKALLEIIKATKGYACDRALVVLTEDELLEHRARESHMGVQLQLCYQCIDTMVMGGSPCFLCNDYETCQHPGKDTRAPHCDIWDLVEIYREEANHEPAAAPTEGEADPENAEADA